LNPHTLRYRNLNPVGVYRDAARCSEPAGSRSSSLPFATPRYAWWTIQRRFGGRSDIRRQRCVFRNCRTVGILDAPHATVAPPLERRRSLKKYLGDLRRAAVEKEEYAGLLAAFSAGAVQASAETHPRSRSDCRCSHSRPRRVPSALLIRMPLHPEKRIRVDRPRAS
jgi:hypothetical protein